MPQDGYIPVWWILPIRLHRRCNTYTVSTGDTPTGVNAQVQCKRPLLILTVQTLLNLGIICLSDVTFIASFHLQTFHVSKEIRIHLKFFGALNKPHIFEDGNVVTLSCIGLLSKFVEFFSILRWWFALLISIFWCRLLTKDSHCITHTHLRMGWTWRMFDCIVSFL